MLATQNRIVFLDYLRVAVPFVAWAAAYIAAARPSAENSKASAQARCFAAARTVSVTPCCLQERH